MEGSQKRLLFLYEFKLGHNAAEATRNICRAFGADAANERTTQRWFEKFRSDDMTLQSEPRGHPGPSIDNDELRLIVESDPRSSIRDIAEKIGVHYSTVSRHLQQLGEVKKLDKWAPHELNEQNMALRMEISSSLLNRNRNNPFLRRIVDIVRQPSQISAMARCRSASITHAKTEPSPEEGNGNCLVVCIWNYSLFVFGAW